MTAKDDFLLSERKVAAGLAFAALALFVGWSLLFPNKPIPLSRVDGKYTSGRCGAIVLRNGTASWEGGNASYVLDTDNQGLFALPPYAVGLSIDGATCSVTADSSKYALKLRFNDSQHPASVTISGKDGLATSDFFREP